MQASELSRLVQRLWRTTLQLPLRESSDVNTPPGAVLTASIRFGGSQHTVLSVTCGEGLANQIAASMFRVRADRVSAADVRDALGEVVNIVGGMAKAVLEPSSQLGLPQVSEGDVPPAALVGAQVELAHQLGFESQGGRMIVRLARVAAA
ncbi:MAG TPA: chemotaxis protein CheX [Polyangiales bacterium]